jgi:ankyrin repeat protein
VLHSAAAVGDVATATFLIEGSADVNFSASGGRAPHGQTPLHLAASKGHLDMVGYLISAGADQAAVDQVSL